MSEPNARLTDPDNQSQDVSNGRRNKKSPADRIDKGRKKVRAPIAHQIGARRYVKPARRASRSTF